MSKKNDDNDYWKGCASITRKAAMAWWNTLHLEYQFYETIKSNDLIAGDNTRHPDTLTGSEIELIYEEHLKR